MALLFYAAGQQDALQVQQTRKIIDGALNQHLTRISNTARDYAWWDEAVENLSTQLDPVWADRNVGRYLANSAGITTTMVVDAMGQLVYGTDRGQRRRGDLASHYGPGLNLMLEQARAQPMGAPEALRGYVRRGRELYAITVAPVTPYQKPIESLRARQRDVLVLTVHLSPSFLGNLQGAFGLGAIQVADGAATSGPTMALQSAMGREVGRLTWVPQQPGRALLGHALPGVIVVVVIFLLAAFWQMRRSWLMIYASRRQTAVLTGVKEDLKQAYQAAKLAYQAKDFFLQRISGQLRTHMRSLLRATGRVTADLDRTLPGDDPHYRREIAGHVRWLDALVDEMTTFTEIEAGRVKVEAGIVEPRLILDQCLGKAMVEAHERSISINDLTKTQALPNLVADPLRLRQVISNLLANAVQYNRASGTTTVSAERVRQNAIRIGIRDTGIGIRQDDREQIFEAFQRVDDDEAAKKRVGLGLAIARDLIELMGGQIHLESEVGEGSTFWIELPVATEQA
jgi:signal transduction histidine kinase